MTTQTSTATPQIDFDLGNETAPKTIYISGEASQNNLILQLTSTTDVTLTKGEVTSLGNAPKGNGSVLFLDLTALDLTESELNACSLTAVGTNATAWTSTPYYQTDGTSTNVIGFTPEADVDLAAGTPLALSLAGFTMATAPTSANPPLLGYVFNVDTIASGMDFATVNFSAAAVPYPTGDNDLHGVFDFTVSPSQVVNTPYPPKTGTPRFPPLKNTLTLQFSAGSDFSVVDAKKDGSTVFTVSFVYAKAKDKIGLGALMSTAQAQPPGFTVTPGDTPNMSGWTSKSSVQSDAPSWDFFPPSGQPLLADDTGTFSFVASGLVTNYQPGPTTVLVSYMNVPGFANGTFVCSIEKEAHVVIDSFEANPPVSKLVDGEASVTLDWTVSNATQLTLNLPSGPVDVTGRSSYPVTVSSTTPFSLSAWGANPGGLDNVDYMSCTARVLPLVAGFEAQPAAIFESDFPLKIALAWKVDTDRTVNLASSITGAAQTSYNAVGTVDQSISAPQMLTLTPSDSTGFSGVSRSLVVSAFSMVPKTVAPTLAAGGVAAPAQAPFVAVTLPASHSVAILDSGTFTEISTVPVGDDPIDLAFSADGSTMFVANAGDGSVSVIAISQGSSGYAFTPSTPIKVGGTPQRIALSRAGSVYVTVDQGASSPGTLVQIADPLGTATQTSATVGTAPRGLAVTPDGGLVFVADSGSDSVSMIGIGTTGISNTGTVNSPPNSPLTAPQDVAVSPDGSVLLIACGAGLKSVMAVNTEYCRSDTPTATKLSDVPSRLSFLPVRVEGIAEALPPTGSSTNYVMVGCAGSAVLLRVDSSKNVALSGTASMSATAGGLCVTPDGNAALLPLSGGGLQLLSFAQYAQDADPVAFEGSVSSAAVSPDGTTALVWSDGWTTLMGVTALTGIGLCALQNRTIAPALGGATLFDLAVSPGARDAVCYVAAQDDAQIAVYTYSASALTSLASIPLPAKAGAPKRRPVRLALSADGTTLFALVDDGGSTFSVVAWSAEVATKTFGVLSDTVAFHAGFSPISVLLAAAPDGSAAFTADSASNAVNAVKLDADGVGTRATPVALPQGSTVNGLSVLPDGSALYVLVTASFAAYAGVIALPSFAGTVAPMPTPTGSFAPTALVPSPDGTRLFCADSAYSGIRILDAQSLRTVQTIPWSGAHFPYGIAVSPDGSRILTLNAQSSNMTVAEQIQPQPVA